MGEGPRQEKQYDLTIIMHGCSVDGRGLAAPPQAKIDDRQLYAISNT
jgi:hypothetical protein